MSVKKKVVSYSQYGKWYKCPHSWYLDYVKNLKTREHSLTLSYGNAIHEALQKYVELLYTKGMLAATTCDMRGIFIDKFVDEITEYKIKYEESELEEFMEDGYLLIKEFMTAAVRLQHFPPDKYEFLGVEDELNLPQIRNVDYWGYIDLVLREKATGRIKIFEIKTARMGWNNYQLEDEAKTSQLVLYKALYSKKHNIPVTKIDVEFFILKRKLYPDSAYKQSRIQIFKPASSQTEVTRVVNHFNQFITECFTPEGVYNETAFYPKIPGKNKKNCKYCLHRGKTCDAIADVKN
jgi:hypothetical protein